MKSSKERVAAAKSAELLSLAASPARLTIIKLISARGGAQVGSIAKHLGVSQSAVSHQLRLLSDAGVAMARRNGRTAHYTLAATPAGKKLAKIVKVVA